MFAESLTASVHHRGGGVDDQLRRGQVGRRLGESQGRDLEQDKEMVGEDHLDGRVVQVGDLFVEVVLGRLITHANQGSGWGS